MNKAIQELYDEHDVIVNVIDAARKTGNLIGRSDALYQDLVLEFVRFFRSFADRYHHYKEEEILFPEMTKRHDLLGEGVIREMMTNHSDFRDMLAEIEMEIKQNHLVSANQKLYRYTNELLDHIAVENDEVFQTAESIFSEDELDRMYFRFEDCDRELGLQEKQDYISWASSLRSRVLIDD